MPTDTGEDNVPQIRHQGPLSVSLRDSLGVRDMSIEDEARGHRKPMRPVRP